MTKENAVPPGIKAAVPAALIAALFLTGVAPAFAGFPESPAPVQAAIKSPRLEVLPTALIVRDGKEVKRIVRLTLDLPGDVPAEAAAKAFVDGDPQAPDPAVLRLVPGVNSFDLRLAEPAKPVTARFEVRWTAEGTPVSLSREIVLAPARQWSVYLFHHSHTDIGYTELQSRVARNHVEYLDSVIKYCRETENYPDDAKFRWNIEISWPLENFFRTRPEADIKALVDLIKSGRVELSALYLQVSDCFAHEEIVRTVDAARELARRYGFDIRSAMNNDVNGFAWSLPQIFRQAGVRYFASGINETRSRAPLRRPNAFWWESPDGSRILHWNGEHYLFANYDLALHEAVDRSAPKVGEYLAKLEARGDYPQDIIAFNVGAWTTDNCPPGRQLSDRVREWNARFVSPKLRLATMREFFEQMEKRYGATLPVHKLGWPDYWTDGVASTAFETGLNRIAHNEILTAEKVSALAAKLDPSGAFVFPAGEIRAGHASSMLYDEHTWGAWNSIDAPWSELARGQWAAKSGFSYEARETSRTLLRRGTDALVRLIEAGGAHEFAVFNPLSWTRTDIARMTLPAGPLREAKGKLRVIDRRSGTAAKFQLQGDDALLILAKDVPAIGYAVFAVETGAAAEGAGMINKPGTGDRQGTIENRFYRITVDPKTGGLSSVFDKELGRELVDRTCPWPLNTYIYEQPEGGRKAVDDMTKRAVFHRWSAETSKVEAGERGPVASSLVVKSAPRMCSIARAAHRSLRRHQARRSHQHPEQGGDLRSRGGLFRLPVRRRARRVRPGRPFRDRRRRHGPGRGAASGHDARLADRPALGRVLRAGCPGRLVSSRSAARPVRRHQHGEMADEIRSGQRLGLFLCHEQLLDDELQGQPGRAGRIPLQPDERAARRRCRGRPEIRPGFLDPLRLGGPHAARRGLAPGREQGPGQVRPGVVPVRRPAERHRPGPLA